MDSANPVSKNPLSDTPDQLNASSQSSVQDTTSKKKMNTRPDSSKSDVPSSDSESDVNIPPTFEEEEEPNETIPHQSLMDSSKPVCKRSLSTTSDQSNSFPQSSSQTSTRKKKKKKNPDSPENEIYSSETETEPKISPSTDSEVPNKEISLTEILSPTAHSFKDSFQDLVEFLQQCTKPEDAPSIAAEYTKDVPGLIHILEKCHGLISDRQTKNRITRINHVLQPPSKNNNTKLS